MKLTKTLVSVTLAILLAGCISPRSYLDPSQQKISYSDLARPDKPLSLRLTTEFQRNGEPNPKANPTLLDNSSRILRASGIVDPDGPNSVGSINIVVNNVADIASAATKGFGTGLTLGLVGSTVSDNYELTMTISINEKKVTKSGIRNGIATAIGNTSIPPGVEIFTTSLAFQKVLEQMILEALQSSFYPAVQDKKLTNFKVFARKGLFLKRNTKRSERHCLENEKTWMPYETNLNQVSYLFGSSQSRWVLSLYGG